MDEGLAGVWPLFGIRLKTARLELSIADTTDLLNLARASGDIQPSGEPRYQKSYLYEPSPDRERQLLRRHWRALADWRPTNWDLQLAIRVDGVAIGVQNMWAADFGTVRGVETGSWITRSHQGQGYGTESRAAVLELAFACLGAWEARTSYVDGNTASERVSDKLGYVYNGRRAYNRDGVRTIEHCMLLEAAVWRTRRTPRVSVEGITPACLKLFDAG